MSARDVLMNYKNPYDIKNTESTFMEAIREVLTYHKQNNKFFNDLLEKNNFDIQCLKSEEDLVKIPPIPANFFKVYESLSIDRKDVIMHVTSSGTSGQKSQMFFDKSSWDFGQAMVRNILDYFNFVSNEKTNYILYTYEPIEGSELGTAKTDEGLMQYAPQNENFFALRYNGSGYDFDVFGTIQKIYDYEKQGLPVRIFGFPSFLYFTLKQMKDLKMKPIKLNEQSMTLLGGGWKGYKDKQISKEELYSLVHEMLGIPVENCRDGYGSTEHSVPYFECKNHHFHIPIYSRIIIRDVKTLKPLDFGKSGFANFITPHILSVPAVSVLMGDLAVLHDGKECGCGIHTPYMEILGRAGTSIVKSCAITASELLKK